MNSPALDFARMSTVELGNWGVGAQLQGGERLAAVGAAAAHRGGKAGGAG
eukprot:COSAG02_NODE_967_length_15586_cov_9.185704_14_plen_49_part_01